MKHPVYGQLYPSVLSPYFQGVLNSEFEEFCGHGYAPKVTCVLIFQNTLSDKHLVGSRSRSVSCRAGSVAFLGRDGQSSDLSRGDRVFEREKLLQGGERAPCRPR